MLGTGARREPNQGYIKTGSGVSYFGAFSVILVLLLCLCVNSWCACVSGSYNYGGDIVSFCDDNCSGMSGIPCPPTVIRYGSQYWTNPEKTTGQCSYYGKDPSCSSGNGYTQSYNCTYYTRCSSQAEADSVANAGKQDTETMEQLESRCSAIGGESHYQFNDQGHVVGYCDICQTDENGNYTNAHVNAIYNDYKASCCEVGKAPNKSNFSCKSDANACVGADCEWLTDPSVTKGGGIGYSDFGYTPGICAVTISTNIDGTIAGCEDEPLGSSSSSDENSSSSGEPGSSSSEGEGEESSSSFDLGTGIEGILDSLHKIIVIDSMNRTYDSLVAVFTSTIASLVDEINQKELGGGDTTIIHIPRDTNIVNVNVGQAAVVSAIESMSETQQATAQIALAKSDTTNDILRGILEALQQGDTSSIYNDSNIVKILTDTTGQGDGDTTGWGAKLDSLGGWLRDSTILKSIFGKNGSGLCDTTGGHKCPSMGGSLDSASLSWGTTYKALGDSLTEGAVGDSLRHWESMLTNNGVISGSGSNSCPSVFRREYTLSIGQISANVGSIGTYICATVPGTGVTFWTIARVVIRAMVAITCMWWLYGAVTGVKTDGGDDD